MKGSGASTYSCSSATPSTGARIPQQAQQLSGADAEVDPGHAGAVQGLEDPPAVRQHRGPVVVGPDHSGPGVEQLNRGNSGADLDAKERGGDVGEPAKQRVPQARIAVHERPGEVVVL